MHVWMGRVGRVLLTVGILVLGFVAYQLWGTGLYESRQQHRLTSDFEAALQVAATTTTSPTPTTAPPPAPTGEAVAILEIPKIGVERAVVNGVAKADLRKGPGHYPTTPLPGQLGNAAIAGHRTTYGAPFYRLDELGPGDAIVVRTLAGTYRYAVTGSRIVSPRDVSVLDPTPTATLTLTTCNPRYSASQRLVVQAALVPERSAAPTKATVTKAPPTTAGLSGASAPIAPAVWWGLLAAAVGALWWWVFHRWHRWWVWIAGALPFAVVLFVFYSYLERALPGNY